MKTIILFLLVIILVGCGTTTETAEDISNKVNPVEYLGTPNVESETLETEDEYAEDPAITDETDLPAPSYGELAYDDASDDCSILTADDIETVCGVSTTDEDQIANINQGQVCVKLFKTEDPIKSVKIFYTGDNSRGGLSPESLAETSCAGMNAEMITDYSCYSEGAGKTVFVYGKKRTIGIANALPIDDYFVCSSEQLKELGKIVSDRLHK